MRILYRLSIIYIVLALSNCASIEHPADHTSTSPVSVVPQKPHKNPLTVTFHKKNNPLPKTYTVIGEETISKYNQGGIKRQEAHIRDAMRELAAAMGGDAVIDIRHDGKTITGTVVAFQKDGEKIDHPLAEKKS